MKKRAAVLECQLRKSEATKKSFELSTGKLLSFVEVRTTQEAFYTHTDENMVETRVPGRLHDNNMCCFRLMSFSFCLCFCRTFRTSCSKVTDQPRATGV